MSYDYAKTGLPENAFFKCALDSAWNYLRRTRPELSNEAIEEVLHEVNISRAKFIMEHAVTESEDAVIVALLSLAVNDLKEDGCEWEGLFLSHTIDLADCEYFHVSKEDIDDMPEWIKHGAAKLFLSEANMTLDIVGKGTQAQEALGLMNNYADYAKYADVEPGLYQAFDARYKNLRHVLETYLKQQEQAEGKPREIPVIKRVFK